MNNKIYILLLTENELLTFGKNPLKCIKNELVLLKKLRQPVSFVVKKQTKSKSYGLLHFLTATLAVQQNSQQ